jgi:hydroxymethylglutaryl-CoA lyase
MEKNKKIVIHEVGPRDGLQVEVETVSTQQKIQWIEKLIASGVDIIQIGSFVNPKRVPQMADTDELFKYFSQPGKMKKNITLSGLVLNEKGLERGMACGVDMFCMGVSASETHSMKNTGMTTDEALERIIGMSKTVIKSGKKAQVSVQSAFGCGYEGKIPEEKVTRIVQKYIDNGIKNISLADTAGHANPLQVEKIFQYVLSINSDIELACHFHDTYGLGIANCYSAWKSGVTYFESSFAGLGGCPFTAIASGNVCTEDLVHLFNSMGLRNDINIDCIADVSKDAEKYFKRELPGAFHKIKKRNEPVVK